MNTSSNQSIKPMLSKRHFFYLCLLSTLLASLGCSKKEAFKPNKRHFNTPAEAPQLTDTWQELFEPLRNTRGKKWLRNNICMLTEEDRQKILATVQAIKEPEQQKNFLESLSYFNKEEQAHLLRIILYLTTNNEELIHKILNCSQCLTILDQLKLYQLANDLPEKCQALLKDFVDDLQE